ncbi:iron-sulfur cluster insertion protein ErpA [Pseudomonas putida]|uniref:Iron-sulfur cluster insertion protein ErpA n=1 Tax=Pseudomonas putida TaxID=303 RepID=A0A8I1EAM2_PSEPU|nr:iron-sulfur cluster insertion protein ErpA [Pseudomonas putida]MBI6882944.1 iron-sulfur cluster insertion protein ErpA [Pseudomonas putida]
MTVTEYTPAETPMSMTPEAAAKVHEFINEEGGPALLRVFVTGGGCSGFQYGFTFADAPDDDDTLFQVHGVSVVIDPMSYQYLAGASITYQESLAGSRFTIVNPNAATTCSCGESFSV